MEFHRNMICIFRFEISFSFLYQNSLEFSVSINQRNDIESFYMHKVLSLFHRFELLTSFDDVFVWILCYMYWVKGQRRIVKTLSTLCQRTSSDYI